MRQLPLSLPEKKFILKTASELKRLDGRKHDEFRPLTLHFGRDWGSCFATIGETKVLATVSCEIQEPKSTRPNEGLLFINVDLSPMAAPYFEVGGRSELGVHLNRMLEKCIKESKAVDLEALCVVADEKVWVFRVDVNIINHEGNILDCASVATLAALAHFKRPDVTTDGQEIKVHDSSERDPIPTTLHHYPVCVSFALMSESNAMLSDPTALEERVADANLVFGVNAYKELCALHLGGTAVMLSKEIMRCAGKAAIRAKEVVQKLKETLAKDTEDRRNGSSVGFVECLETNKITSLSQDRLKIQLGKFRLSQPLKVNFQQERMSEDEQEAEESLEDKMEHEEDTSCEIVDLGEHSAELITNKRENRKRVKQKPTEELSFGTGGPSKWDVQVQETLTVNVISSSSDDEIAVVPVTPKKVESVELSGDSDEEQVHVMDSKDLEAADNVEIRKKEKEIPAVPSQNRSPRKRKGKRNKNKQNSD